MIYKKKYDEIPVDLEGCFIAGGSILATVTHGTVNDYDIYPKKLENVFDIAAVLIADYGCILVDMSDKALTFKSNQVHAKDGRRQIFQVVTIEDYPTADSIFESFDFTVCMAAYDCDTKEFIFHEQFWCDVANKQINFNSKTKYPLASFSRLYKYGKKGFSASKGELIKMALTVIHTEAVPDSWESLATTIGGFYGKSVDISEMEKEYSLENALEFLSTNNFVYYTDDDDISPKIKRYYSLYENAEKELEPYFKRIEQSGDVDIVDCGNVQFLYDTEKNAMTKIIYSTSSAMNKGYQKYFSNNTGTFRFTFALQRVPEIIRMAINNDSKKSQFIEYPSKMKLREGEVNIKRNVVDFQMVVVVYTKDDGKRYILSRNATTHDMEFTLQNPDTSFYVFNVGTTEDIINSLPNDIDRERVDLMNCKFTSDQINDYVTPNIMFLKKGTIY